MVFTKEDARAMSVLDVAQSLGMELKKSSSHIYEWVEHDSFKIDTRKNTFYWYSQGLGGDTIRLVEMIKEVSFREAMTYLRTGEFSEAKEVEEVKQPFRYQLGRFEQPFDQARAYLKDVRGFSDETIDFFLSKGVLAQARKKAEDNYLEPVIVFKSLDRRGRVIGASYQGIIPNQERYEGKGYLKQIAYNSDGMSGLNIAIGQPRRLVFAEAPIDLMSYYEAYKDTLQDVRLVAMDGLKPATISRYLMENLAEQAGDKTYVFDPKKDSQALEALVKTSTFFHDGKNQDFITLAVDNDKAGRAFIERMQEQGIPVQVDIPPLPEGEQKMDWNDYLKRIKKEKGEMMNQEETKDNSRLAQAKRKLERLEGELEQATQAVFAHQAQTNGQPMNDKRGNAAFFKRRDQLENKAISLTREIEAQKERIEDLEWKEERKERGLNRKGSGLDMSVANIPRIREEIERFYRGESFYIRATIKNYEKRLVELEAMAERNQNTALSLGVQYLIDEGLVTQWQKQPTIYFVKGLRKVAFILQENGEFAISDKYKPKTAKDKARVEELLELSQSKGEVRQETPSVEVQANIIGFLEQNIKQFQVVVPYDYSVQGYDELFLGDYYVGDLDIEGERSPKLYVENALRMLEWTSQGNSSDNPEYDLTINVLEQELGYNPNMTYERLYLGEDPIMRAGDVIPTQYRFNGSDYASYEGLVEGVKLFLDSPKGRGYLSRDMEYYNELELSFKNAPLSVKERLQLIDELSPNGLSINGHFFEAAVLESISQDGAYISLETYQNIKEKVQREYEGALLTPEEEQTYQDQQIEASEEIGIRQAEAPVGQEVKEKSLEQAQGIIAETNVGGLPGNQEAAPLPEANISQPLNGMSPHQTQSQPLLHFTIDGLAPSTYKKGYHPVSEKDLRKLNRYTQNLQQAAQFYLNELADTKVTYFYSDGVETGQVSIEFGKEHFMHLTGLLPQKEGQTAEQTLLDFANGQGHFDNLLIANYDAAFEKLQVLPELQEVIQSDAFYFDDLSDIEKLHRLDLDKAIRTSDKDLLLALRTVDGATIPASVMRLKNNLNLQLDASTHGKTILGVYRERDGQIDLLSINETYIKDGGKELRDILERSRSEEVILEENQQAAVEKSLDSDGDGISNEDEIRLGTDPYNAQSAPGKAKKTEEDKRSLSDILEARDMAALSQHMKGGLEAYTNSDQYKLFLKAMSKFHDYSLNNVQLLLMQKPDISLVAGFNKWKEMGRNVEKGQKALKIWQPVIIKKKDENGRPILDENGKEKTVTHFKLGNVFDVSQTQGKELPKPIYNLENGVTDYENLYRAARQVSLDNGIPISFGQLEGTKNGRYNSLTREIILADKKMSEAQIMKTLFHEMAHSDLHFIGDGYNRSERELQAESIAYVVANHYGIDTSEYSFGYLHTWSQDQKGYEDLVNQLQVVQKGAQSLISRIDTKLELIKSKSLGQDKFQSKLAQAKDKSAQAAQEKQAREQDSLSKKPPAPAKEL